MIYTKASQRTYTLGCYFYNKQSLTLRTGLTCSILERIVVVLEYKTKKVNDCGYEAHKRFIDIQCVLKGQEQVACFPIERLKETKAYSEEDDAAFYSGALNPLPSPRLLRYFIPTRWSHASTLCGRTSVSQKSGN